MRSIPGFNAALYPPTPLPVQFHLFSTLRPSSRNRMNRLRSLPAALRHRQPRTVSDLPHPLRYMSTEASTESTPPDPPPKPVEKLTSPGSHRDMRRVFYIDSVVDKIMNKSLGHPYIMWMKTRAEWYRLLKSERGCRLLLNSKFISQLRSLIREDELEAMKRFGTEKVCLARSYVEYSRIKKDLYRFKYLSLMNSAAEASQGKGAAE